ncbi:MAG TPA: DUF4388 domain-containing protein [Pyrinomonadaceae bacterium]|nr:DUF4388 domain-containing protein [Pyrinomonadaceae bacterium]
MALTGSLQTMSVPDLLQFLAVGRKTGLLKFSTVKVVKGIYFENGVIVGSSTNDPREYLGQVLIHYGKITEAQLQAAMEAQRLEAQRHDDLKGASNVTDSRPADKRRLGQVLVESGVITTAEVIEVLEIRTLDIIYDLFLWKSGTFEFSAAGPLPADFTRVYVEPNRVIMEGVYRSDELARYQSLIPSERTIMELGTGWTSSVGLGKTTRQLLYFLEKRMSVAEISYNMHSSPFEVYGQLFELVQKGLAQVSGELPETSEPELTPAATPNTPEDLLAFASLELEQGHGDKSLAAIHTVLEREPNNEAAHALLVKAEQKVIARLYQEMSPTGVPRIIIGTDELADKEIGPQEGFMLSRINGEWDLQSILSICPFREADSLRMIKNLLDKGIIGF